MLTKLYPMVQFQKDTWEIDEFDCASLFLLIGEEKAMLIDCGMGIGDLKGAVRMLTDKPLVVVISQGHIDHTGNARQFDEIWIHPKDQAAPIPQSLARRRYDTERIARRQKNCIGGAFSMFRLYPFDINEDLREPEEPMPVVRDLYDGQQFDLGGRIVTAYECPGHSPGEMMFLDEKTRSLFCGDALNFNLGVSAEPVEKTLRYLKRMRDLGDRYDGIYNGHHDFRALGMPLDSDCLPTAIAILEDVMAGHMAACEVPSFWGADMPLSGSPVLPHQQMAPAAYAGNPPTANRITLRRGRNFVSINPKNIYEESHSST